MTTRTFPTKIDGPPHYVFAADVNALATAITALSQITTKGGFVQGQDATGTEGQTVLGAVGALMHAASTGLIAYTDVAKLVWDAANGRLGIGQATPTAGLHLPPGVAAASGAPVKFASGVNLTAAEAGALEYDGKAFYATAVAGARGLVDAVQFVVLANDFALAAASGAQNMLTAANDALTVPATTTFQFEAFFHLSTGATTHTTAFGFGGTATLTGIQYFAELWSGAAATILTTAPSVLVVASAASTVLNATSTAVATYVRLRGVIRVNAGGTLIPQINFSANPTGTNLTKANSFIRLWPVGANTVEAMGAWA